MKNNLKKFIPLLIILLCILFFYFFHVHRYITFEMLQLHHLDLKQFVRDHYFISIILAIICYMLSIILALPITWLLAIGIGYLFVFPFSTFLVIFSGTAGACIFFLSAKIALSEHVYNISPSFVEKVHHQLETNGTPYLITVRILPLIPFWMINMACAVLNIPFITFLWTTLVGIIPSSILYTYAGDSLNSIFEKHGAFSIKEVFTPHIQIAFGLLIIFLLLPIIIRKMKERHHHDQ